MGCLLKIKNFNPLWFKRAGRCDSPYYYWRRVGVLEISRVGPLLALCSTRVRPAEMRHTSLLLYPRLGELLLQYLIYVQYRFDWLHGNELCITGGISAAARLCRNAPLAHYCVGVTCTRIHVIRGLAARIGTTVLQRERWVSKMVTSVLAILALCYVMDTFGRSGKTISLVSRPIPSFSMFHAEKLNEKPGMAWETRL